MRNFNTGVFGLGAVRSTGDVFAWLSDGKDLDYTNWDSRYNLERDCVFADGRTGGWGTNLCTSNCTHCNLVCQRNGGKFSCYFCH